MKRNKINEFILIFNTMLAGLLTFIFWVIPELNHGFNMSLGITILFIVCLIIETSNWGRNNGR